MMGRGKATRQRDSTLGTGQCLGFLLPFAKGAWHCQVLNLVGAVATLAAELATPWLIAVAIDQAVHGGSSWGTWAAIAVLVAGLAVRNACHPLAVRFDTSIQRRLVRDATRCALEAGLPGRRPISDGDLLERLTACVGQASGYIGSLIGVTSGIAVALGSLVAVAAISPWFVLLWGLVTGTLVLGTKHYARQLTDIQRAVSEYMGILIGRFLSALRGFRTVRASDTLEREVERIVGVLPAYSVESRRQLEIQGRLSALYIGADTLVVIFAASIGILLFADDAISVGSILAAIRYVQMAFGATANVLDNGWFHLAPLRASVTRIHDLLATPPATAESANPVPLPVGPGVVKLHNVYASVPNREPTMNREPTSILRAISMNVAPGTTVAIVGRSGVGKTTLVSLVGRLVDPDRGTVTVDGTNVRDLRLRNLGELVGYAFERPFLLGDTIAQTIRFGKEGASDDEVMVAAHRADAHSFIERLPEGYETPLASAPLSGGEMQRLGLARLALRSPRIMILDDALSSLDIATETRVAETLASLGENGTTIVITHRLSTAAAADQVVWLMGDRVRGVGAHASLLRDPDYRGEFAVGVEL